jgi:hypothetical protein
MKLWRPPLTYWSIARVGWYLVKDWIDTYFTRTLNNPIVRRIHNIMAFSNSCWNSYVGDIVNDGTLFRSNSWQNMRARWRHTSKHCAPSNILWVAFTLTTPLHVIRHTVYHQALWFFRWIRNHHRGWSWSVNILGWKNSAKWDIENVVLLLSLVRWFLRVLLYNGIKTTWQETNLISFINTYQGFFLTILGILPIPLELGNFASFCQKLGIFLHHWGIKSFTHI